MSFPTFLSVPGRGRRRNLHNLRRWNPCHLFLTIQRKNTWSPHNRWHMSNIITVANWQNTFYFYSPADHNQVPLSTNTQKKHIKQLSLRSKVIHKWQIKIHISQTVSNYLQSRFSFDLFLQKKGLNNLFCHITTTQQI